MTLTWLGQQFGPGNPCDFQRGELVRAIQNKLLDDSYQIDPQEQEGPSRVPTFGPTTCGAFEDWAKKHRPLTDVEALETLAFGRTGVCQSHFYTIRPADCRLLPKFDYKPAPVPKTSQTGRKLAVAAGVAAAAATLWWLF